MLRALKTKIRSYNYIVPRNFDIFGDMGKKCLYKVIPKYRPLYGKVSTEIHLTNTK